MFGRFSLLPQLWRSARLTLRLQQAHLNPISSSSGTLFRMSKRNTALAGAGLLVLAVLLLSQVPAINSRLAWRFDNLRVAVRQAVVFVGLREGRERDADEQVIVEVDDLEGRRHCSVDWMRRGSDARTSAYESPIISWRSSGATLPLQTTVFQWRLFMW